MKRGFGFAIVFALVLVVSSFLASAFWPFDIFKKEITGNAISEVSCDVKVSRTYLPTSDFFTDGTAKTPVFGSASGSFNDNTYVKIDCNVNDVLPEPARKIVKAKKTFTSSELHYSGDCVYPSTKLDTNYKVSAKIYPGGVECVGAVDSTVVRVQGTGKEDKNAEDKACGNLGAEVCEGNKCNVPYVHDGYGKCAGCPSETEYSDEKCLGKQEVNTNPPEQNPAIPEKGSSEGKPICDFGFEYVKTLKVCLNDKGEQKRPNCEYSQFNEETKKCPGLENEKKEESKKKVDDEDKIPVLEDDEDVVYDSYGFSLYAGKVSYFGIPYFDSKVTESACNALKYYVLDAKKKKYERISDPFKDSNKYNGKGIAIKSDENCKVVIRGKRRGSQEIKLEKGWNLISSQAFQGKFEKYIKSDCRFKTKLIRIDPQTQEMHKEKVLFQGYGYFVKVEEACKIKIGIEDEDEIPLLK